MSYCPNCGAVVEREAASCSKCLALFGSDGWVPVDVPVVRTELSTWPRAFGKLFILGGHFFLVVIPALIYIPILLSGVQSEMGAVAIGVSLIGAIFFYVLGGAMYAIGQRTSDRAAMHPDSTLPPHQ